MRLDKRCALNLGREFGRMDMCSRPLFIMPGVVDQCQTNVCPHGVYILEERQVTNQPHKFLVNLGLEEL